MKSVWRTDATVVRTMASVLIINRKGERKMKIMISQPMRGKTNEQIRAERAELILKLEAEGHEVIDTVLDISENKSPLFYLSKSIELLDKADAVVFMPGWQQARGCRIEETCAKEYRKFLMYL